MFLPVLVSEIERYAEKNKDEDGNDAVAPVGKSRRPMTINTRERAAAARKSVFF